MSGFSRLDRYSLRLLAPLFTLTLLALLVALLLDRLLRLFDFIARAGGGFGAALWMAVDLIPHYLGLALPAAFFASIFFVVARQGDDNELDAQLAAGRSIMQISAPYLVLGGLLSVFCFGLYGFLQPYGRYGLHKQAYEVAHAGWNARVQENTFIDAGHDFTLSADQVDSTGRQLQHVFLQQQSAASGQITITAQRGELVPTGDGHHLQLSLQHGRMWHQHKDGYTDIWQFARGTVHENFNLSAPPFRPRGDAERELTLPELWQQLQVPAPSISRARLAGEFNARVARALLLPLLPLLGVPLGMAAKRGRRMPGVVFAVIAVLAVHHALEFGESLAKTGNVSAVIAVWTPYFCFAALSGWLFRASLLQPGENPVNRAVAFIEGMIAHAGRRSKRS